MKLPMGPIALAAIAAGLGAAVFAQAPAPAVKAEASEKPGEPGAPPNLSSADKATVVKIARGMLDALWTGGNAEDVPGAPLRFFKNPVAVTVRRSGQAVGRAQAHGANLLEGLREAVAGAVAEAKAKGDAGTRNPADLRLDIEIAGEDAPVKFRHVRTVSGVTAKFMLTADSVAELKKGKAKDIVPEAVLARLKPLLNKPFAEDRALRAEMIKLVPPDELFPHLDRLTAAARTSAPANISGDILEQCRRGIHGLLIEHHGKRITHGRTYAAETVTENLTREGFVARAFNRAQVPEGLLATELKFLLDEGTIRVFRFRTVQLVETDGKGGYWEPARGHAPVTISDVSPERVEESIKSLADYMARRQILMNALNYFPSIDEADKSEGPSDRATVAWAMAETAARYPKREVYHRFALAGLGRIAVSTRLITVPARQIDFLPIRPEERIAPKAGGKDHNIRIRVVPEADGERAHLGASAMAVTAMTAMMRLPIERGRTVRALDPDAKAVGPMNPKAEPKLIEIDVAGPRNQLLLSVIWMQNRDAGPPPAEGVRPREEEVVSWLGSFRSWFPPTQQPAGVDNYHGHALLAIATAFAEIKDPKLREALLICINDSIRYYGARFKRVPTLDTAGWHIPAFAAVYAETGEPSHGEPVLHMADWMLLQQVGEKTAVDPDMVGGFLFDRDPNGRPGVASALFVHALCSAYRTAQKAGDIRRAERYREGIRLGVRFLLQLQFAERDTYYCRRADLARGGIRSEIADNSIHQSGCAHALLALMRAHDVLWGKE
jgi:hypothetical protein